MPFGRPLQEIKIEEWLPGSPEELDMLAEVLHATVHAGASVGFILPFSIDEARDFWRGIAGERRRVLVAYREGRIVGTVQLNLATMPNQRHRADVMKLLVHPSARRLGIARALMTAIEDVARSEGRTLLTLDTRTGDNAEPLYLSLGYMAAGVIPGYARAPNSPELDPTTYMYKNLAAS